MDLNQYDEMFHAQTRDRPIQSTTINYHLFGPKYQNNQDHPGYEHAIGDAEREETKRGQRMPFPGRTAPFSPNQQADQERRSYRDPNVSHSLMDRQITSRVPGLSATNHSRVDDFNSLIDSMHLPEDMSRPVATRDMMKAMSGDNFQSQRDQDLNDRQFAWESQSGGLLTSGAGSFEDMFY